LIFDLVVVVVDGDNECDQQGREVRSVRVDPERVLDKVEVLSYVGDLNAVVQNVKVTGDDVAGDGQLMRVVAERNDLEVLTESKNFCLFDHHQLVAACVANEDLRQEQMEEFVTNGVQDVLVHVADIFLFRKGKSFSFDKEEIAAAFVAYGGAVAPRKNLIFQDVFHSVLLFYQYNILQ